MQGRTSLAAAVLAVTASLVTAGAVVFTNDSAAPAGRVPVVIVLNQDPAPWDCPDDGPETPVY